MALPRRSNKTWMGWWFCSLFLFFCYQLINSRSRCWISQAKKYPVFEMSISEKFTTCISPTACQSNKMTKKGYWRAKKPLAPASTRTNYRQSLYQTEIHFCSYLHFFKINIFHAPRVKRYFPAPEENVTLNLFPSKTLNNWDIWLSTANNCHISKQNSHFIILNLSDV